MCKHIHSWNDLSRYGINVLTGEACAYSLRLLCDMSCEGVHLMSEFLGIHGGGAETLFAPNWNSRVGDDPAIASIMLSRGVFNDLCHFALFRDGCAVAVLHKDGGWSGYTAEWLAARDLTVDSLVSLYGDKVYRNHQTIGAVGSRNVHQMSGRAS